MLNGIRGLGSTVPGSDPTQSAAPSIPLLTGTFTRTIPVGTAVVRANGLAGTWTISVEADGSVRVLAPTSFAGPNVSRPLELQADTLRTDAFSFSVCSRFPAGTYRWSVQSGYLVLTALADPCDARVVVLAAGPWKIRS